MPRTLRGATIPPIVQAARELRGSMTPSEQMLWEVLRGRKCMGLKFRRQHPIGPYVLDFFCVEKMLAIELDGGIHNTPEQSELDAERTKYLNEKHIHVLRIKNEELKNITCVFDRIAQFITLCKFNQ